MWYYIYRQTKAGSFEEIGRTRYRGDAEAVFERWHAAYIIHNNQIIKEKHLIIDPREKRA